VRVITLPFELHPEIPPGGYERSRSTSRWGVIAAECADVRLPFDPQERSPNTRKVLELSEWVRRTASDRAFTAFEGAVFRAHFANRLPIDDVDVLDGILFSVGVDPAEAWDAVAGGEPSRWVDASMALAREVGVAGTPAWLLGGVEHGMVVPGVQPRGLFERVVGKLQARADAAESVEGEPGGSGR
jgi:predicted DsbA family dithiol-disulfide isomerase